MAHPLENGTGELVRCRTRFEDGSECHTVLWRAWTDRVEVLTHERGGECGGVEFQDGALIARTGAAFIKRCGRCNTRWLMVDPMHPVLAPSGGVLVPVS